MLVWTVYVSFIGAAALFAPMPSLGNSENYTLTTSSGVTTAVAAPTESLASYAESLQRRRRASTNNPMAFRVGVAFGDDSGLLLGVDIRVPSISIGAGWTGRLDFDVFSLGGDDTNIGIILNQISSPDGQVYYGFGLGVVAGDDGGLGIKLLIGTTLTEKTDIEFNAILHDDVTAAIVFRLRM